MRWSLTPMNSCFFMLSKLCPKCPLQELVAVRAALQKARSQLEEAMKDRKDIPDSEKGNEERLLGVRNEALALALYLETDHGPKFLGHETLWWLGLIMGFE